MKYVKFDTLEAAMAYLPRLQDHHDETINLGLGPKIIDCIFPTYDGKFALSLQDDTYPDVGNGEVVDTVEPPVMEEPK